MADIRCHDVDAVYKLTSSIPEFGDGGNQICDEIELQMPLFARTP